MKLGSVVVAISRLKSCMCSIGPCTLIVVDGDVIMNDRISVRSIAIFTGIEAHNLAPSFPSGATAVIDLIAAGPILPTTTNYKTIGRPDSNYHITVTGGYPISPASINDTILIRIRPCIDYKSAFRF